MRFAQVSRLDPQAYHELMNSGFRRSGQLVYQPACPGCRACQPLRVPVQRFRPSRSQRRAESKNSDLQISIAPPVPSSEKFDLYCRYMRDWHHRPGSEAGAYDEFCNFLYNSPVRSIEFCYRDNTGTLLAVGICDLCGQSLSSVYFYFEPAARRRSLGTFGALQEIAYAGSLGIPYYYLGYFIYDCGSMSYKAGFSPCQILATDGIWRDHAV
jgi:arginine-tRNA-protein transferase